MFCSEDIPKTSAKDEPTPMAFDAFVSFLFHSKSIANHPTFAIVVKGSIELLALVR
jgi:hypothetical protein